MCSLQEEQQKAGLCNGRLFSCMGHAVTPDLPTIVLNSPTNVITFLREPFARLQSGNGTKSVICRPSPYTIMWS